jgi:hypothetical protein
MTGMLDKISRALGVASVFQANTVRLIEGNADTEVTLSQAQKNALLAIFDTVVASVKADGASL